MNILHTKSQISNIYIYKTIDNVHTLMYNIGMMNKHRRTKTVISLINYHFVFLSEISRDMLRVKEQDINNVKEV